MLTSLGLPRASQQQTRMSLLAPFKETAASPIEVRLSLNPEAAEQECNEAVIDIRVLFVSGDEPWLQQIKNDLLQHYPTWICLLNSDSDTALTALSSASFAAVVVDSRIPEAPRLLKSLQEQFPTIVRVVLCNFQDRSEMAHWQTSGVPLAPQNCDAATIVDTIKRSRQVSHWLADPAMKKLLSLTHKLPTLPRLHSQIATELESENSSLEIVASLIGQDPLMSAKLLQVANSAFFALAYTVSDPREAVMVLGVERTRAIILLTGVFSQFNKVRCPGFSCEEIWKHSLEAGEFARIIALTETGAPKIADAAFTAGLLHDIGKLILASNAPDMYTTVQHLQRNKHVSLREAEKQIIGTTHGELGACLLGTWALPMAILDAIAWHHCPSLAGDQEFSLLTAVHVANVLLHENSRTDSESDPYRIDEAYLLKIGLHHRRNAWREACGFPEKLEEDSPEDRARRRREAKEN